MNGQLEFFGVDDMEPYRAAEHFMCTNVEWDPTGRYVATSVTSIHQMENGFNLWLFNGTPLYRWGALWPLAHPEAMGMLSLRVVAWCRVYREMQSALASCLASMCRMKR